MENVLIAIVCVTLVLSIVLANIVQNKVFRLEKDLAEANKQILESDQKIASLSRRLKYEEGQATLAIQALTHISNMAYIPPNIQGVVNTTLVFLENQDQETYRD